MPDSPQGFGYIVNAIKSGQFQKIGTNPRWIPELEQLAERYNVELFSDYKQVHAHLEVVPNG